MEIYAFADEACSQLDGQITAMLRNELNGLEIRGVDGSNISDISLEKAKEIHRKLTTANLSVWSVASPIGKIQITDEHYPEHLEKLRHTLEIAQILEAKRIRIFSFYIPQDTPHSQYHEEVICRLQEMVSIADGTGIELCHENEKGIYGSNAQRCLELLKAVPHLHGVFDPANFVQCGQDALQAWQLLHPYINYLHIKDATSDGTVVPAGKGAGNLPTIIKSFQSGGGYAVTVEPHLAIFDGLSALENSETVEKIGNFTYPSNDIAFDVACNALKALI